MSNSINRKSIANIIETGLIVFILFIQLHGYMYINISKDDQISLIFTNISSSYTCICVRVSNELELEN
jgi:hypothetical protein